MSERTYVEAPVWRRPVVFLAEKVKTPPFSEAARREAGALLALVQEGEDVPFPASRPLPDVGPRCHELRVNDENVTWRIIYRVDPTVVLVPTLFAKKTRTLPRRIITLCRRRLADYDEQRKRER
jgi:phage-related protein